MDPPLFSILTPNAMLGYGYRQDHFWYGVETYRPRAIIVDSGSTDGGPYKLGMNKMTCGREAYIRDLAPMLEACFYRKITVMIGSAGGDGSNSHVGDMVAIVQEIADRKCLSLKVATIKENISRDFIKKRIRDAAHTLYEKTRPDRLPGPGGILVLDGATYEQLEDEKTVRVTGAAFVPSSIYQIKLEGVKKLGYRTIFIGGIRDPILISQIDDYLDRVRQYSKGLFPDLDESEHCRLIYHVYGRNAVMGPLEPESLTHHELGIMGEVVAETQERSHTIANNVRTSLLHMPYDGQLATTGNFASPLSPHEQAAGGVFKFSVYHLIDLDKGEELKLFPVTTCHIDSGGEAEAEPLRLTEEELEAFRTTKPVPIEKKQVSSEAVPMMAIAKVVRSKNSGPFELTLDIMFDDRPSFERVKSADLLTNDTIKRLYQVGDADILVNIIGSGRRKDLGTLRIGQEAEAESEKDGATSNGAQPRRSPWDEGKCHDSADQQDCSDH
ncbi:putative caib baif family enzyme [Diplodia seriata]|uniref:Putative caib baif family enzyme n=1 Tax=Diplodia seriata TaxID=420778 RepID=A0A0G2GE25_9PEZI|nr:putative caib baif family enzyme [Diplodia seriata]